MMTCCSVIGFNSSLEPGSWALPKPVAGARPHGRLPGDVSRRPMSRRRQPSRRGMAKVLTHMCMSLDGFVAQPDDNPAELFDWYWSGEVVVPSAQESMSFSVDAASAPMLQELMSGCGALI